MRSIVCVMMALNCMNIMACWADSALIFRGHDELQKDLAQELSRRCPECREDELSYLAATLSHRFSGRIISEKEFLGKHFSADVPKRLLRIDGYADRLKRSVYTCATVRKIIVHNGRKYVDLRAPL